MYCITGTREGKVWCNALHSNLNSAEFWRTESDWLTDYCYVTDTANNFPRSQPEATPLELYSAHIPRRYPWAMALPWTDSEIESAIRLAFAKLGYEEARSEQLEATREFVKDKDVFISLPTGSGKSLCYGCLPLVFDHLRKNGEKAIVVVISPLRALMLDQAHGFSSKGVESVYVADGEAGNTYEAVTRGRVSLIFMSPESLMGCCKWREMFRSPIYQRNLVGLIIDEAHCIDKW